MSSLSPNLIVLGLFNIGLCGFNVFLWKTSRRWGNLVAANFCGAVGIGLLLLSILP